MADWLSREIKDSSRSDSEFIAIAPKGAVGIYLGLISSLKKVNIIGNSSLKLLNHGLNIDGSFAIHINGENFNSRIYFLGSFM